MFEKRSDSKISEFARLVQSYRNSLSKDEAHVPLDFNRDFNNSQMQWGDRNGPAYAISGIDERFEDDFDSEDSEFNQLALQQKPGNLNQKMNH